jgi:hypothetical protein
VEKDAPHLMQAIPRMYDAMREEQKQAHEEVQVEEKIDQKELRAQLKEEILVDLIRVLRQ